MSKDFEVLNIDLNGKKLIEASAGTGKTFSVALLVLRMVIEQKISINQILLMTFTNAAVAEMEERIRLFIRQSYAYLNGHEIDNESIMTYFNNRSEADKKEDIALLKDALLDLDQISVLTIHAFCSKMLREFSFESGQIFGAEPIEDLDPLINIQVDQFWRSHVATLPKDVIKELIGTLQKNDLNQLIKSVLGGKKYFPYRENFHYDIIGYINQKNEPDQEKWIKELISVIKCTALQFIIPAVQQHLREHNLISFDNIIENMDQAIHSDNGQIFKDQLRKKFKAVFIDEFQDTDRHQYEIFKTAFIDENPDKHQTIVFLIADGKQMIYAFRKADMATYFRARNDIGQNEIYSMKENFRSSKNFISALNVFFESVDDPFHFSNDKNKLEYEHVLYPSNPRTKGELTGLVSPFTIVKSNSEDDAMACMMMQLKELLSDDSAVWIPDTSEKEGKRKIRPNDIGILVRFGYQAIEIKNLLSFYKIPAVKIDDTNILETKEAKNIFNLLIAFLERSPGNIRRALISSFTNHTYETISGLDMDKCSEQFRVYHDYFLKKGIYKAMMSFLKDYSVQHYLLFEIRDERGYSNLIQILEILHEAESDKKLSPQDLVSWFKRNLDQKGNGMKIFEERMESDENAVKIITIHKSKGLEYPIVFNPFLDLTVKHKELVQLRDSNGDYLVMDTAEMKNDPSKTELHRRQNEQENRRLIYVALTRARYACFVYNIKKDKEVSSLDLFVDALSNTTKIDPISCIESSKPDINNSLKWNFYQSKETLELPATRNYKGNFPIDNWWKMSYTRLSGSHSLFRDKMEPINHQHELEAFIFNKFPKGAKAGNILHAIMERIDFTVDKSHWHPTIQETLQFYRIDDQDSTIRLLAEWIDQILHARICINGNNLYLNQITLENRINEFEFDFKLQEFDTDALIELSKDVDISINPDLGSIRGIMNGKMDMFFRYDNKYYILDWKSNFLGYDLHNYDQVSLDIAMSENNYHLQYLIYTVAAKLYLSARIKRYDHQINFGGVIYVFARGVRSDSENGIFTTIPKKEIIEAFEEKLHEKATY